MKKLFATVAMVAVFGFAMSAQTSSTEQKEPAKKEQCAKDSKGGSCCSKGTASGGSSCCQKGGATGQAEATPAEGKSAGKRAGKAGKNSKTTAVVVTEKK